MNNLFSEIFGCYYKVITEIVNNSPISVNNIMQIINKNGFEESCFHLLPKIEALPFIEKRGDKYYSLLENKIKLPLTTLEKSWLKAISSDARFDLFNKIFDKSKLEEFEPLFEENQYKYYDKYSDGDDFCSENYKENFYKINDAIEKSKLIKIVYKSPKRDKVTVGHYIPIKFEFSSKDDKLRIFATRILDNKTKDYFCLNLNRILEVRYSNKTFDGNVNLDRHIEKFNSTEPIIVEIHNERNAIERFMVEFSTYQKNSEFNEETQTCTTKIYYRKSDETELLIKLLSFGPTLKVLGSKRFISLIKTRIQKQYEMIKK